MLTKRTLGKSYCKYCGAEINEDSKFCKRCGKNFNQDNSLFNRLNREINILAIFIGLLVSVLVLFIGSSLMGMLVAGKVVDIQLYIFLVLFFMLFLGGLTAGLIGCNSIRSGLVNGGFLGLVFFVIVGIILGIYFFVAMGIASVIASAFSSFGTSSASSYTNSAATSSSPDAVFLVIKGVLVLIISYSAGVGGGAIGAWIKEAVK
ncbi:MAG: zinc-ribbon domain-containing protein [Methanobacterium sp.]|nr:zinc-ribbon domain-containing protein [Methanobacterium sp.]